MIERSYFELDYELNEFFVEEMINKIKEASSEDEIQELEEIVYREIKNPEDDDLLRMFDSCVKEKRILLKLERLEDDYEGEEEYE